MNKSAWAIARLNLKSIKVSYVITGVLFLTLIAQDIIQMILASGGGSTTSNTFWLLVPLAAVRIGAKNFRRIVNLGGKRRNFFAGCFFTYLVLAAVVSLATIVLFYTYDKAIENSGRFWGTLNLLNVFGWAARGPVIAFFQQFAFLFLLAVFTHTLTLLQDSWIGWTADGLLIAVIAVFTPIEPLRRAEAAFFHAILFQPNAFLQILTCLALAVAIYALNKPVLNHKKL